MWLGGRALASMCKAPVLTAITAKLHIKEETASEGNDSKGRVLAAKTIKTRIQFPSEPK